jgi:hypothetical protein
MKSRTQKYFLRKQNHFLAGIGQPIDIQVKWQIIENGIVVGETPDTLDNSRDLVNDLGYTPNEYRWLCIGLKQIVNRQNRDAVLKCSDVYAAATVGACIKLVMDTLK